jgi:hypothetical protein
VSIRLLNAGPALLQPGHQVAVNCSLSIIRSAPMTPLAAIETAANTITVRTTEAFIVDSSSLISTGAGSRPHENWEPTACSTLTRLINFRNFVIEIAILS